ncbi:MAG TPA: NnrS family protein [Candidatus Eisenbacteria bacterium]|nr:NnrS family protein [Candidatus Eisenbacteria bacterium]
MGRAPQPYQVLFPIGVVFALIGLGAWPAHVFGLLPYPGALHRSLMIQGFETSFILGFLLTAMPAFTHGPRCHPLELAWGVFSMVGFGVAAFFADETAAQEFFLFALTLPLFAGGRRVLGNPQKPPEEFAFVAFGLALGLLGGALRLAESLGVVFSLPARLPERLLSLGMVLSLVVGVGSLLVPTFAGMRDPLVIPGVAKAHERAGRRALYAVMMAVLALAFVLESAHRPTLGMAMRATAVTVMVTWVWKLYRLPRRDAAGFVLWGAGWFLPLGLLGATLDPLHAVALLHFTYMGGFALLTIGIGTRVIVSHGGHALELERRVLDVRWLSLFLIALALRVIADFATAHVARAWAASAVLLIAACGWWAWRVLSLRSQRREVGPKTV